MYYCVIIEKFLMWNCGSFLPEFNVLISNARENSLAPLKTIPGSLIVNCVFQAHTAQRRRKGNFT